MDFLFLLFSIFFSFLPQPQEFVAKAERRTHILLERTASQQRMHRALSPNTYFWTISARWTVVRESARAHSLLRLRGAKASEIHFSSPQSEKSTSLLKYVLFQQETSLSSAPNCRNLSFKVQFHWALFNGSRGLPPKVPVKANQLALTSLLCPVRYEII